MHVMEVLEPFGTRYLKYDLHAICFYGMLSLDWAYLQLSSFMYYFCLLVESCASQTVIKLTSMLDLNELCVQ